MAGIAAWWLAYPHAHVPLHPKATCLRMVPPAVGWALLHQSAIKKMEMCSPANLIETNSSAEVSSLQTGVPRLCQAENKTD